MIETPLRFFKRTPQQFSLIRSPDQSAGPMNTIVRQTLDENRVRKTQLPPIGLHLRRHLRRRFAFVCSRVVTHGVFHW